MAEKRHAETSTEEPVSKKQAITTQMYEAKIAELEKRNMEAQEMTQEQIEKFQERTAVAEEKFEKTKKLISKLNKHIKELKMWIRYQKLLSDNYHLKPPRFLGDKYSRALETEFKNKINITKENYKSVQDEINQLMD